MVELSPSLRRRLDSDFGQEAQRLGAELEQLPESINSGQDPERIQASVLLAAGGSVQKFDAMLGLARLDWRDLLVNAGFENGDYANVMRRRLGR
jgi:hypothetical protein